MQKIKTDEMLNPEAKEQINRKRLSISWMGKDSHE